MGVSVKSWAKAAAKANYAGIGLCRVLPMTSWSVVVKYLCRHSNGPKLCSGCTFVAATTAAFGPLVTEKYSRSSIPMAQKRCQYEPELEVEV